MVVRAVFGNPYRESLLRVAFDQGRKDRLRGMPSRGCRTENSGLRYAYEAGYQGRGWHRSPNGQVKWHKGGA